MIRHCFREDKRFRNIKPSDKKIWLASPTMHGEELEYVKDAYETNWMSTVGENIEKLEGMAAEYTGVKYALAVSSYSGVLFDLD